MKHCISDRTDTLHATQLIPLHILLKCKIAKGNKYRAYREGVRYSNKSSTFTGHGRFLQEHVSQHNFNALTRPYVT